MVWGEGQKEAGEVAHRWKCGQKYSKQNEKMKNVWMWWQWMN